jgi:hypothetical protein
MNNATRTTIIVDLPHSYLRRLSPVRGVSEKEMDTDSKVLTTSYTRLNASLHACRSYSDHFTPQGSPLINGILCLNSRSRISRLMATEAGWRSYTLGYTALSWSCLIHQILPILREGAAEATLRWGVALSTDRLRVSHLPRDPPFFQPWSMLITTKDSRASYLYAEWIICSPHLYVYTFLSYLHAALITNNDNFTKPPVIRGDR